MDHIIPSVQSCWIPTGTTPAILPIRSDSDIKCLPLLLLFLLFTLNTQTIAIAIGPTQLNFALIAILSSYLHLRHRPNAPFSIKTKLTDYRSGIYNNGTSLHDLDSPLRLMKNHNILYKKIDFERLEDLCHSTKFDICSKVNTP